MEKSNRFFSVSSRALGTLTALWVALVGVAMTRRAEGFPQPVVESLYARSQPWITFVATGATQLTVNLGISANCTDPVSSRALASTVFCQGQTARPDVYVHIFAYNGAEQSDPVRCTSMPGTSSMTCVMTRAISAGTNYALMIHGGPSAVGNITGSISIQKNGGTYVLPSTPIALSGNLAVDITGGFRPFDITTVLVPDARGTNGPTDTGNRDNDYLGTDATEVWVLGANGRAVVADIGHRGVGAAGMITGLGATAGTLAIVRPWARPQGFSVFVGGLTLAVGHGRSLYRNALSEPIVNPGRMRVIFNDRWNNGDTDQDGLSDRVESELQLCNGALPFASNLPGAIPCTLMSALLDPQRREMQVMDPRDTDGDGLSDGVEVLGSDVSEGPTATASGACNVGVNPSVRWDADQTFPLWGFSPRHKDALVEADRASVRNWTTAGAPPITACTSASLGCNADRSVFPYRPSTDPFFSAELAMLDPQLFRAQTHMNSLLLDRVANPDAQPGIQLHYDMRLPVSMSFGHGNIPRFWTTDGNGNITVNLIAYIPGVEDDNVTPRIGSSCGCSSSNVCPSQRHGGYSNAMVFDDSAVLEGGGTSSCDGAISCSGINGTVWAHEFGHHWGLGHSSPTPSCAGSRNPFAPQTADGAQGKVAHVSMMNYRYSYYSRFPENNANSVMPSFSFGARAETPVPRQIGGVGSPLVTPEQKIFGLRTPSTLSDPTSAFAFTPLNCTGGSGLFCEDTDVNNDGVASAAGVAGSVNGADGEGYRKGLGIIDTVGTAWCPTERRAFGPGGTQCCAMGTLQPDGTCSGGTRPGTELFVDNTPMLSGQPLSVIANNRFFSMYWDSRDRDTYPLDCRCPVGGNCSQTYCNIRTLRWSAWDRLVPPTNSVQDPHCFSEDCRRTTAGQVSDNGWLLFGGSRLSLAGVTTAGAATIEPNTANETVVLGYTSRAGQCPTTNTTDQCGQLWTAGRIWFANATTMTTTGFVAPPVSGSSLAFPPGTPSPSVDSISIAAFNPTTGAADMAYVVVRKQQSPMPSTGSPLWFTTCTRTGGCAVLQPLVVAGAQLFSRSMVSLAVTRATMTEPRIAYLMFEDRRGTTLPVERSFRLARRIPAGASSLVTIKNPSDSPIAIEGVSLHSGTNIEFTKSNQLMMVFEQPFSPMGVVEYRMGAGTVTSATTQITTEAPDANAWNYTRERVGQTSVSGLLANVPEQGPGRVPFLRLDDRAASVATTPDTANLAERIRMTMTAPEASGILAQFWTTAENTNLRPYFDYEEHSTLGFYLCRTLESSARARRSPDLAGSTLDRVRCPGGAAFRQAGAVLNAYEPVLQLRCRPYPLCNLPDPRFTSLVAQWVADRTLHASSYTSAATVTAYPPIYTNNALPNGNANWCPSESAPTLPVFPGGWQPTQ
ncbi:MAG: thrombospondin type 3 repeat-containing protein [Deltaproteobacteria bacterium]|nr:thrombospondin type 3 repeat-containing protein [Deltaproteobacteria bacterium]